MHTPHFQNLPQDGLEATTKDYRPVPPQDHA